MSTTSKRKERAWEVAYHLLLLFMKKFESDLMPSPSFPRIWLRYVDDVFAIIDKTKINTTLIWLNSQHPNIQFTSEIEKNNQIPFLDVMVERCSNTNSVSMFTENQLALVDTLLQIPSILKATKTLFSLHGSSFMQF
jgi:hypothetical protein